MRVQLKVEIERALKNRMMAIALLMGCLVSISHFFQYVYGRKIYVPKMFFCPESVFYNWIGASSFPMQSYLYYLILPIIAVLPAGASYYDDIKSGYIKNVFIRTNKKNYLIAKYVAVFLSGGVAFVMPLLLNLLLTAMYLPALKPEPIMDIGPALTSVGCHMYYTHPFVYVSLFLVFDFVFAGGFACVSLICTYISEHRITVLITPFVFYYFLYALNNIIASDNFSPNYFLIPGYPNNTIWEFIISIIGIVACFLIFLWRGIKDEVF